MITTKIEGIDVKFPFEPYEIQRDYMSKVLKCLSMAKNGVLESPTGTGKTLSLLCSSLAWLENKKNQLQLLRNDLFTEDPTDQFFTKFQENVMNKKNNRTGKSFLGLPTIIYASRTHSQLSQAVSEMRLTAYNYLNGSILGSREQLCIHPEVMKEHNFHSKITMCNLKTKTRTCHFYNNLQTKKEDPKVREMNIVDIEDLVTIGKSNKVCPYFLAKEFKSSADIVFMPYNYLLEPRFRKNLGIELSNNVIILDEAHNVEHMLEESASLQIKSTDIALAIEEVTAIMKIISEESTTLDEENVPKDFSADDLIVLKEILLKLEEKFDAVEVDDGPEGKTFEGVFMYKLLQDAGIDDTNYQRIIALLEILVEYLSVVTSNSPFQRKGNAMSLLADALRIIFMDVSVEFKERVERCYKVHMVIEGKNKKEKDSWVQLKSNKEACRVLNFWCFSPGFGMKMLLKQGVLCCILTSGTLAPLKPLITELELNDPILLENPHVVKDSQICVRIISNGPDNERLSCTYQNRSNENYLRSLGSTIMNIVRIIPNGLLIFFPSYPILNLCMEYWQKHGIWTNIITLKPIYIEPRDKVSFVNAMTEYYEKINDPTAKGAIFMGVCRGKISEGLDFADLNGRGVIIVGLPFPPLKDPRVILKKKYLDRCRSTNQEFVGGDKWYTLEACRAVNQAIGRVIRHRNDYGAILLLDERYKNYNIRSQLSLWLRDRIKLVQNFGEIVRDLRLFYKNASDQFPLSMKKKKNFVPESKNIVSSEMVGIKPSPGTSTTLSSFQFSSSFGSSRSNDEGCSSTASLMLEGYKKRIGKQAMGISKKLKIRLVPNTVNEVSTKDEQSISEDTKEYIAMVRNAFDVQTFKTFVNVLQIYQKNKDIEELKENLDKIFRSKHHLRYLLQGVERYVDKDQKDAFKEYCQKY